MDNIMQFRDWILVGGQNGLIYFQKDNIGRVYKQTFEAMDWFESWRQWGKDGRLYWMGTDARYEVRENADMPGFLEFSLTVRF